MLIMIMAKVLHYLSLEKENWKVALIITVDCQYRIEPSDPAKGWNVDSTKKRDATAQSALLLSPAAVMLLMLMILPNPSCSLMTTPIIYGSGRLPFCNDDNVAFLSGNTRSRRTNHNKRYNVCYNPLMLFASTDKNDHDEPEKAKEKGKPKNANQNNDKGDGGANSPSNDEVKSKPNILEMINPFIAGKNLRNTVIDLASAITNDPASRLPPDRRSLYYNYYVDDQLGLSGLELKDDPKAYDSSTSAASPASSSWLSSTDEDYRPEVLVVGAAGALGRVLVKRLILENKVRVRVLVRDLYSSTLNKLGTGVTYCQGDLNHMESLEYAVTDVDKIVFCAGGKRELHEGVGGTTNDNNNEKRGEEEWDALETILEQRSKEAQMIDGDGLRNLLHAYQNVRHADYGTSQAAKRVLFKFRKRPADFGLFGIDDGSVDGNANENDLDSDYYSTDEYDSQGDYNMDGSMDGTNELTSSRPISSSYSVAAALSQCDWKRNKFGYGIFVGKVGRYGEAAIASARLRSRNDPEQGIDLRAGGFAGLVCRVCSDGGVYEAFVRTEAYERLGVEYVCEFKTSSKSPTDGAENTSRTKWSTVRLEFSDFRPRMRQFQAQEGEDAQRMKQALGKSDIPPFMGRDIRQLGFRYRGKSNIFSGWSGGASSNSGWNNFYLALDFIKVYRGQPEPEFVYLSDARIPPVVNDAMVNHDLHRLMTSSSESTEDSYSIIYEERAKKANEDKMDRIAEETYFKYMGEDMIKRSGLSYTVIRVAGYNADLGTDSSAVRLQKMNKNITSVSRVDLAQVIASALLEPNACNLILYMTKAQQRGVRDGDIWQKFARLRSENDPLPFQ